MPGPDADRPQYADGSPVPDQVDATTAAWSRGVDPHTGAKGAEPAEPVPVITSFDPESVALGDLAEVITVTGTNLGGTSKFTVNAVDAIESTIVSETEATFRIPAGLTAGERAVIAVNPAGNSAPVDLTITA